MKHFNLIKADFRRIFRGKALYILLAVSFGYIALMTVIFSLIRLLEGDSETYYAFAQTGFPLFLFMMGPGIVMAIAVSIFVGSDYSYNTFRNKITAGNSREKIYFSALTLSLAIGAIFFVVFYAMIILGARIAFGGFFFHENTGWVFLLFVPIYVAMISIMVFVSMNIKSNAGGIVINIAIVYGLTFISLMVSMVLGMLNPVAAEAILMIFPHSIREFLHSNMATLSGRNVGLAIGISFFYIIAATVGGIALFRRKAIK